LIDPRHAHQFRLVSIGGSTNLVLERTNNNG